MRELRKSWLITRILWGEQVDAIRQSVSLAIREPITESEHASKLAAAREEWVPVDDLADFLVGQRDFWQERHHYVANTRWW